MKRLLLMLVILIPLLTGCDVFPNIYVEENQKIVNIEEPNTELTAYSFSPNIDSCYLLNDTNIGRQVTMLSNLDYCGQNFINLLPFCKKSMSFVSRINFFTIGFYRDGDCNGLSLGELIKEYPISDVDKSVVPYIIGKEETKTFNQRSIILRDTELMKCSGSNKNFTYYAFFLNNSDYRLPYCLLVMKINSDDYLLVAGMQLSDNLINYYKVNMLDYYEGSIDDESLSDDAIALNNYVKFFISDLVYGDRSAGLTINPIKTYVTYDEESYIEAIRLSDKYITVPKVKLPDNPTRIPKPDVEVFGAN